MSTIKGYKVFNPDWTCRGYQYKVGETFTHEGDIEICNAGFHFCQNAADCFYYYNFNSENKVAEVEAIGLVETKDNKSVTDKIRIIREIPWQELLTIVNIGNNCTGLCNTGDWNSTNYSTGFFNSVPSPIYIFNKPTELSREEILNCQGMKILYRKYKNLWWIDSADMTEEEKAAHPEHKTTGGYLKKVDFKTACRMMWDNLNAEDRNAVMELPNFDSEVFKEITGIDVMESEDKTDE